MHDVGLMLGASVRSYCLLTRSSQYIFKVVNHILQDITQKEGFLFGGIPFILDGDFV